VHRRGRLDSQCPDRAVPGSVSEAGHYVGYLVFPRSFLQPGRTYSFRYSCASDYGAVPLPGLVSSVSATPTADEQEVLEALDYANQIDVQAFREGNAELLKAAFTGAALSYYEARLGEMLARGERQENRLISSQVKSFQFVSADRAKVTTEERWHFKPVGPNATGEGEYDFIEYYELVKLNGTWYVAVNEF